MRTLRFCVRLVALAISCSFFGLLCFVGQFPAAMFGRRRRWQALVTHLWGRCMLAIIGMRVRVQGEAPTGAFLLVSNHLSYVDILLLASRMRAAFVAKAEIRGWPFLGFLATAGGTIFIDRGRNRDLIPAARKIQEALDAGVGVILFPEGTSTAGTEVAPFRSSLLEPAARLELPVRHASIRYRTPSGEAPATEAVSWWGDTPLGAHLPGLLGLPSFEARLVFGEEAVCDSDRKELAARLHRAVSGHFEPMPMRSA